MRKPLFIAMLHIPMPSIGAQCNRNAETEKDRYGPVIGIATTTTDCRRNRTTVYKDMRGHAIGSSLKSSSCNSTTTTGSSCWKLSVSR